MLKILLFLCWLPLPIFAEIQSVTIKWTSVLCEKRCPELIIKYFSKIAGVASIDVNREAGMAVIAWKPDMPFSFVPINGAMSMVGLSINDIRVKVRGTIIIKGQNFYLNSLGDNTKFLLLNRVAPPVSTEVVEEFNAENRYLTPDLRTTLANAKRNNQIATLEGPLFEPERSPPRDLFLVIDQMSFEEPEKKTSIKRVDKLIK